MSPFSHTLALLIITLSFYFISLQLGTDAMASKSKQKEIVKKGMIASIVCQQKLVMLGALSPIVQSLQTKNVR